MIDSRELDEVYQELMLAANELMDSYDPLMVAGCMISQALSIYRTALTEEQFSAILDSIVKQKDRVEVFTSDEILH